MTFNECANFLKYYVKPKRSIAEEREYLFSTMKIHPDTLRDANLIVDRMYRNKNIYQSVSARFPNKSFKWYIVALFHSMECNLNFSCYLGNGQPYSKKTTIVPKGRGPFKTWVDGAIDAIRLEGLHNFDWSNVGEALWKIEKFNGQGYAKYHPEVNTPYLWAGTNHYTKGKYYEDRHGKVHYDPNLVSKQIGVAVMYKLILDRLR